MPCSASGCEGDNRFPYECERCGGTFCPDHRLPESHNCPGLRRGNSGGAWFPEQSEAPSSTRTVSRGSAWTTVVGFLLVVGVIVAGVGFAVANPGSVPSVEFDLPSGGDDGELEEETVEHLIHEEVNDFRANQSLEPLEYDDGLAEIAGYHSSNMAADGDIYHTSPEGQTIEDRYERFDYDCRAPAEGDQYFTSGENVAKTWYEEDIVSGEYHNSAEDLAEGIVQQWIDSPEHRENLVKDVWWKEGIGVNITEEEGRTAIYVTQNFC